jgi:hypothetical protein
MQAQQAAQQRHHAEDSRDGSLHQSQHLGHTVPLQDQPKGALYHYTVPATSSEVEPLLTKEQHDILEAHFQKQPKPTTIVKGTIAESLKVSLEKVVVSNRYLIAFVRRLIVTGLVPKPPCESQARCEKGCRTCYTLPGSAERCWKRASFRRSAQYAGSADAEASASTSTIVLRNGASMVWRSGLPKSSPST